MTKSNVTIAAFGATRTAITHPLYQYDYGQVLVFKGIDLPEAYEVHFSNEEYGTAKTQIGGVDGVTIPDEYLVSGADVHAWVFLHDGEDDGETEYKVTIPVRERAEPSDEPPTPEEQSVITQAIAALNHAVEQTAEDVVTTGANADRAESAAQRAESAASDAEGYATRAESAAEAAETSEQNAATSATNAAQSATAANTSAQNASRDADRAEQAAANAGYMWIDVNANGHLVYERTDAVDVDFELDNGHLIMEAV